MHRSGTLVKQPAESRLYTMDASGLLASDEVITSVTSVTADEDTTPALTLGPPTYSGKRMQVRIGGGKDGVQYKISFLFVTSQGNTVEADGNLIVRNL